MQKVILGVLNATRMNLGATFFCLLVVFDACFTTTHIQDKSCILALADHCWLITQKRCFCRCGSATVHFDKTVTCSRWRELSCCVMRSCSTTSSGQKVTPQQWRRQWQRRRRRLQWPHGCFCMFLPVYCRLFVLYIIRRHFPTFQASVGWIRPLMSVCFLRSTCRDLKHARASSLVTVNVSTFCFCLLTQCGVPNQTFRTCKMQQKCNCDSNKSRNTHCDGWFKGAYVRMKPPWQNSKQTWSIITPE